MTRLWPVLAVALALWSGSVAAQAPEPPVPFGPGPVGGVSARTLYAVAEAGPVSSQRLRAEVAGSVAVVCGLPACLALEIRAAAEIDRLDGFGTDTQAGFGGLTVGAGWWPVRGPVHVGVVARAADLGRSDDAGGNAAAGLETRVGGEFGAVAVRLEGLRRRARGGFAEAYGSRAEAHVEGCRDVACVGLGGGVTVLQAEAVGRLEVGVAGRGQSTVRMAVSRELSPAGAATLAVEWRW